MFRVRPAYPEDFPALAEIFRASRMEAFHWCETGDFFLSDFEEQTEGEVIYLAEDVAGRPVGFISVWVPDRFIHHLFVDPAFQGQGIGSLLVGSLRDWLPFPYGLKCLVANRKAQEFYHSRGWREISRGGDEYGPYLFLQLDGLPQPAVESAAVSAQAS